MAGATLAELQELQRLMVKGLKQRVEADIKDDIPTDAATLGVIAKLLKDNNVMVDPADADDLAALREKLAEQSRQRRTKASNVVSLLTSEMSREAHG